ncbi:MAG: pseudouridine synthase [Spirochaetaceae bacterium]
MHDDLRILHSDDDIVLLDKPAGLIVHPNRYARREPNLVNMIGGRLQRRVYTVHRLDRGTSGLMLFALSSEAAGELSRQFRTRAITKGYLAAVRGHPPESGTIDKPLRLEKEDEEEREATTHFTTLATSELDVDVGPYAAAWFALVELTLETGRPHQARRHLRSINHPVIGDQRHGDRANNRYFWDRLGGRYLLLRALRLAFDHPRTGARITAYAGISELWRTALAELGLPLPPSLPVEPQITEINVSA